MIPMKNSDGKDAFAFYPKATEAYEDIIKEYSYTFSELNDYERVYVVQDSFVLYVGLINYGDDIFPNYRVVFEELLNNDIYKFNASKFARSFGEEGRGLVAYIRFHGIWGVPLRSFENNRYADAYSEEYKSHYLIPSKCYEVSEKLPQLNLRERFDLWGGNLYFYIIYELIDGDRAGYAIYCSQNLQTHKIANEMANQVEWSALEHYAFLANRKDKAPPNEDFSGFQFEYQQWPIIFDGVNCDSTIIDLLCERIELHKANGWEHKYKKHAGSSRYCIAEHDLKYFILERYAKTKQEALKIGRQLFQEVHDGKHKDTPRYEYIIPENKWKSEQMVFEIVKRLYKNHTVLYQHRPYFLHTDKGQMSYDVFICGLDVAIEYQGKQHFEPVEIFGGEDHFKAQVVRDKLKKELSEKNGVKLVYINYDDDISPDLIKKRIESTQ